MKNIIKGLSFLFCTTLSMTSHACTDMCWSYEAVMAKHFQGKVGLSNIMLASTAITNGNISSPNNVEFAIRAARNLETTKNNITISAGGEIAYSTNVIPRYQIGTASIVTHIQNSSIAGTFKALKAFGNKDDLKTGLLVALGVDLPIVKNDYTAPALAAFGTTRTHIAAQPSVKLVIDILKPIPTTGMAVGAEVSVKQVIAGNSLEAFRGGNTINQITNNLPKTIFGLGLKLTAL